MILHLTNKPIFPLIDGGCVAMNELQVNLLQAGYQVKYFTIATQKHPFSILQFDEKRKELVHPEAVVVNTQIRFGKALKSFFNRKSYNLDRFYSPQLAFELTEFLKNNRVDAVIFDSLYAAVYLDLVHKNSQAVCVLRAHNVEHKLWEQQVETSSFWKKPILRKLARDLKKDEIKLVQKMDQVWAISKEDAHFFSQIKKENVVEIPVSVKPQINSQTIKPSLFFLGSMNWPPNVEAYNIIEKKILPEVQAKNTISFHVAGSFSEQLKTTNPNVYLHGQVPSSMDFMKEHGILIAPFFSGSGIRIKILEAMNLGIPVISTSLGFQGIPVKHQKNAWIAESMEEMKEAIEILTSNIELATSIGLEAKKDIQTYFGRKKVIELIIEQLGK